MDLQMEIKPKSWDGLLFWSSQDLDFKALDQTTPNFDYISLGFAMGSLQLSFNLGSGETVINYNNTQQLFDGGWHFIRVQRYGVNTIILHQGSFFFSSSSFLIFVQEQAWDFILLFFFF